MCFVTTISQKSQIATEDIECWKFLNPDLTNAFSKWIKTKIQYVLNVKMPVIELVKELDDFGNQERKIIRRGYHSFPYKPHPNAAHYYLVDDKHNTILRKFIIPKGTRYYEGLVKKEYVSETIILVEE